MSLFRVFTLIMLLATAPAPASAETRSVDPYTPIRPRARLIIDNDFGGDPDGLFQLAHHLLSPTMEIRGVIASQHHEEGFYGLSGATAHARDLAAELVKTMGLAERIQVLEGAPASLCDMDIPSPSAAADLIVREAMRDDVKSPLYVACGAGLTNLASAYLVEPRIGPRLRLIWIGGPEHEGLATPPPGKRRVEYNLGIDRVAAQVVFNRSDIPVWQIPRDAYRQALVSYSELLLRVKPQGPTGGFLMSRLDDLLIRAKRSLGETYVLGDNPLVLLTALQTSWEVDPASSRYVLRPTPLINDEGWYEANPEGRPLRVYTSLDVRLMLEDFFAKLALHAPPPPRI
jgi:inosine-uridine nucleoside N-ribohydrolase